uniref:Proteolipid protein 2 n=1 Tax=Xenopus tropicalis TaxID=8364 RepID=A0A803JLY5_XENTR
MSDSGPQGGESCMSLFRAYLRTRKGIILAAETVLCFVIVVCYGASNVAGYLAVAVIELVFCIIYFFVFAGKYDTQLTFIHWGWSDFLRCAIACLLFLITSLITLLSRSDGAGIAGAVFGLLAGILFGYDGYMTIPLLRKPHAAVPTEHCITVAQILSDTQCK